MLPTEVKIRVQTAQTSITLILKFDVEFYIV